MSESAIATSVRAADRQSLIRWLACEIKECRLLYLFVGLFITATIALSVSRGDDFIALVTVYVERTARALSVFASGIFAVVSIRVMLRRSERPTAKIMRELTKLVSDGTLPRVVFACALLAIFMAAFLYHKTLIPVVHPFDWDETFMRWDRALFAGRHPWEILHPLLGYPAVTRFLDFAYSLWVPLVFIFWAGLLASSRVPAALRRRYWLATVLAWVGYGIVMATILSSAGPCFAPALFPQIATEYQGLNSYLAGLNEQHMLSSTIAKDFLWQSHINAASEPGGISAMPSMHNVQATLFALAAYRIHRTFGHAMSLYAVLIFLGSIHLAWHYAVDGIVGVAAAVAIWQAARLLNRIPAMAS